ncbi:MAG: 23S rRNA (uracil(1939)-C(5))-methyltransferase RlmD [Candidatus Sericytochromatia bacterium]|nr:23S rRNA (uracil(1939)-C(5))-methyltransferase RlmD [Candidatus Sericytochromatia bacterium]
MGKSLQPLRVGDRPALQVEEMVVGGESLARYEGLPVFIPFGVPGDRLIARVISTKPGYARALIEEIDAPGVAREEPPCDVFGVCGGCQWQMLSRAAQAQWKKAIVEDSLRRIAGISPENIVADCLSSPEFWHYRNKVHWAIEHTADGWKLGLFEPRSHRVVTTSACALQHPTLTAAQHALEAALETLQLTAYSEQKQTGFLRSTFAKVGHRSGELMVGIVTREASFPQANLLVERLREQLPHLTTVVQNVHRSAGNKLMGPETRTLYGPGVIKEELNTGPTHRPLTLSISPVSFFQVNGAAVEILYDAIANACGLPKEGPVGTGPHIIDAYSGTGAIALFLAARGAGKVTGIEIITAATNDAAHNASVNGLESRVQFITGAVENLLGGLLHEISEKQTIVLDPPRKGCETAVIDALLTHHPERIVYVSCNPATQARDIKRLTAGGYQLQRVQPVDMFPQTAHVECIAELRWSPNTQI